jgi:hypothetical protein
VSIKYLKEGKTWRLSGFLVRAVLTSTSTGFWAAVAVRRTAQCARASLLDEQSAKAVKLAYS